MILNLTGLAGRDWLVIGMLATAIVLALRSLWPPTGDGRRWHPLPLAASVLVTAILLVSGLLSVPVLRRAVGGPVAIAAMVALSVVAFALVDFPLAAWRKALDINLTGYFICAREAARLLLRQDAGGSIINLTSKSGLEASKENSAYNATKAGEIHLMRGWALELGKAGIRVKINVLPSAQYWDIWNAPTNPFAFTAWTHRPLGVMVLGLAYRTGVPWNESHWSNAKFDELLSKAEGILDPAERSKVVAEIETLMLEEGPACIPLWRAVFTAMDKRLQGFQAHPTSYFFCEEWSLEA